MKVQGDSFKYFFNNESKTREEIEQLIDYDTTVSLDGFNINYSSLKKDNKNKDVSIPSDAKNLEVFSIKKTTKSPTGKEAYIGFKSNNGNFNFISVPFTEPQDKIQEILKEADKHQKQNGGILKGVEFPFDGVLTFDDKIKNSTFINLKNKSTLENKVIEDWNRKEFYIISPSKENLDRMCESFEQRVKNNSNKCGIINTVKQKFAEVDAKVGQKHNKLKAPLDILQTRQFPKALQLLALATSYGHHKYLDTDSTYMNFKSVEGGSQTYLDAASRHATDRNNLDNESGLHHFIHSIWNGMAALEIWAEENKINIEEYSKNYLKNLVVSK